jgi:SAM-dependent methyltransferase
MTQQVAKRGNMSGLLATTLWEQVATTRWGAYVTAIEKHGILKAQSLLPPCRALEVGCEGGRWSKMLADLNWQMTCIDVNPRALNICQAKIPQARCILADPKDRTLPCLPESQDLLLCVEVGPVIQSDWFLAEARRVLKPNGVFVGTFWNSASWRGLFARTRSRAIARPENFYNRSYSPWRRDLLHHGFDLIFEEGFCWGPFSRASDSKFVSAAAKSERLLALHRLPAISPWIVFIARKNAV